MRKCALSLVFLLLFLTACVRPASTPPAPTDIIPSFANLSVTITPPPAPDVQTSTPTAGVASATSTPQACRAADFSTSADSNDTGSGLALGLTLLNVSPLPCQLTGSPNLTLLDAAGHALNVQSKPQTPQDAMPQPTASFYSIAPGNTVIVTALWSNACQPFSGNSLKLRLTLPDGEHLDAQAALDAPPACTDKSQASLLEIYPYTYPP